LGRLLMNQSLLGAGYPWVTVRSDERVPFFKSIERAQVDADAVPASQGGLEQDGGASTGLHRATAPPGRLTEYPVHCDGSEAG
jgi:hypothetical protein